MSTSRAKPTAPMAMPTLAPVLRPLESLEAGDPAVFVPIADVGVAVEVGVGATDLPNDPDGVTVLDMD